jgi:transposase InsO family protein
MQTITELAPRHGVRATCVALAVAPASYYRCRRPRAAARPRSSPRALTSAEQQAVLGVLHGERFVDVAPEEVVATLLDEERYLCSARTMYRLLAARLIAATCERQGITPGQLTLHADRGSSMRAKTVALLLADLGVTKTHSRPYTSMDNPYSEALFKTAKYRPAIPERFGSLEHARQIFGPLFAWYNTAHRHSGLALLTPQDVHHGVAQQRLAARAAVLAAAYAAHPERFPRGLPTPGTLPTAVWINKPATPADTATTALPASARIDALEAGRG